MTEGTWVRWMRKWSKKENETEENKPSRDIRLKEHEYNFCYIFRDCNYQFFLKKKNEPAIIV